MKEFFARNFLRGIFLEEFFERNILGGFFWRNFWGEEFFGRNHLFKVIWIWKGLICLSRFWFLSRFCLKAEFWQTNLVCLPAFWFVCQRFGLFASILALVLNFIIKSKRGQCAFLFFNLQQQTSVTGWCNKRNK